MLGFNHFFIHTLPFDTRKGFILLFNLAFFHYTCQRTNVSKNNTFKTILYFETFIFTNHPNFRETWPNTSYLKSIDFWGMLCFTYLSFNALEYGLVLAFAHQDPMKINTENAVSNISFSYLTMFFND